MPAAKKYYDAKDIMTLLGVGKNTAYEILHMFEERGLMFRYGKVMRVRQSVFENWLLEQEEYRPRSRMYAETHARLVG